MENYTTPDSRITSPTLHYFRRSPREARLNGRLSWCTAGLTYLHIDPGNNYKVTSIATQGGRMNTGDKWVKQYKVAFYAGATHIMYTESGLEKVRHLRIDCKTHILFIILLAFFPFLPFYLLIVCTFYKSHKISYALRYYAGLFRSSFQVFRYLEVTIITIE